MRVTISKVFVFDAAHWLPKVAADHKCRRMHGHTYRVEVVCEGEVREDGMLVDYQDIADAWSPLHERLDHRVLNEVPGLVNPTTEVLAPWILDHLLLQSDTLPLARVRVYESSTTWCEAAVTRAASSAR